MKSKNTKHKSYNQTIRAKGKTAAGTHVPIMVKEVLGCLKPTESDVVVDCTVGYGGHGSIFLKRLGDGGKYIGLDVDGKEFDKTVWRLKKFDREKVFYRTNFSNIDEVFADEGGEGFDVIFADIGVSSMQVDTASRGISYKANGPLDMRMDDRLEKTGIDLLSELSEEELSRALWELSDEPDHKTIAQWIVGQRLSNPVTMVDQLVRLVFNVKGLTEQTWKKKQKASSFGSLHPAARTFQTLRILVNDELGSLRELLEKGPTCLKPKGRIGIISFHSGEDNLVRDAFKAGFEAGTYSEIAEKAIKPTMREIQKNPRSASARFRYAVKG